MEEPVTELSIELCGLERRGGALCEQCGSAGGAASTGDGTARAGASGVVLDDGRRGAWFTWGRGARGVDREPGPGVRGQGAEEKEGERRKKEKRKEEKKKEKEKGRKRERKKREGRGGLLGSDCGAGRARAAVGRHAARRTERGKEKDGTTIEIGCRDGKNF